MSREEDIARLARQYAHARSVAAEAARTAGPATCPVCDSPLPEAGVGCASRGHGKPSWLAQHRVVVGWSTFLVLTGIGFAALFTVGAIATGPGGAILNAILLVVGAGLVAYGGNALAAPTSLTLVDLETDAFGHQYGRNPRGASSAQGTTIGAVCIVIGLACLGLGIGAGAFI